MRTVAIIAVLSTLVVTLSAQVPVKKDILQMLDKIPAPPTNVKDAFAKIVSTNDYGNLKCSAEKLFISIDREVKEIEAEFAAQPRPDVTSVMPGFSSEDAKKMNDPEMKKKMKKMSKEEKMKMAMEMMNSMPASGPAAEIDPPPVRAALEERQKLANDAQEDFQRSVAEQQEEMKLTNEYEKSHSEINTWEAAEISKLPQISSGEMSAADPVKVNAVQLKSSDKHIIVANKRLEQIRSQWRAYSDYIKKRYTAFHQKLAAANYAADSKNFSTKKILADAQLMILTAIGHQISLSRKAWEESASWQARRVIIENQ
jgi:hypothetical protein